METEQTTGSHPGPSQAAVSTQLSLGTKGTHAQQLLAIKPVPINMKSSPISTSLHLFQLFKNRCSRSAIFGIFMKTAQALKIVLAVVLM